MFLADLDEMKALVKYMKKGAEKSLPNVCKEVQKKSGDMIEAVKRKSKNISPTSGKRLIPAVRLRGL